MSHHEIALMAVCWKFLQVYVVISTRMKVVNLKQAILQAWKERWSDYQWAINIKKNFPKGATWDYLNLAGKRKESEVSPQSC